MLEEPPRRRSEVFHGPGLSRSASEELRPLLLPPHRERLQELWQTWRWPCVQDAFDNLG